MTKADLKKLFEAAMQADAAVDKAKLAVDEATDRRSEAVKAIVDATDSKGPFEYKGKVLKIRSRDSKDDEGKVTNTNFFFVAEGSEITKID